MNIRNMTFQIRVVSDKGTTVKSGTDFDALEDALWELYEMGLCPFAPDEDDILDEDDDSTDLDDEFDTLDTKEPDTTPLKEGD